LLLDLLDELLGNGFVLRCIVVIALLLLLLLRDIVLNIQSILLFTCKKKWSHRT
jgi:hypothetical protein